MQTAGPLRMLTLMTFQKQRNISNKPNAEHHSPWSGKQIADCQLVVKLPDIRSASSQGDRCLTKGKPQTQENIDKLPVKDSDGFEIPKYHLRKASRQHRQECLKTCRERLSTSCRKCEGRL